MGAGWVATSYGPGDATDREPAMTRLRLTFMAAGSALLLSFGGATASASTSFPLSGMFTAHFPQAGQGRNVYQCPPGVFCGVGTLKGLGPAEIDVFDGNFQPIDGTNCLSFDKEDDVSLIGTNSTLVLEGSGTLCFPGNSGNVPTNFSNRDYGHPSHWTSDLTVNTAESSGIFAGATGRVTETFTVAGGVGIWKLAGDISTP